MSDAVVPIAAPARRGSYVARHWRGELSLPKSYWLNGVLLWGLVYQVVLIVLFAVAINLIKANSAPALTVFIDGQAAGGIGLSKNGAALAWTAAILFIALQLIVYIWALVGIWRSAGHYKGAAAWKVLARVAIVLGVLVSIANITRTVAGVEQMTQAGHSELYQ